MEFDHRHKSARLGEHVPGYRGYGTAHYRETDLQLRRVMTGEIEKVRDRLAALIAGIGPGERQEEFGAALRETAALKDEIAPSGKPERAKNRPSPCREESLLDFDLALLENIAGLQTPLDRLETAGSDRDREEALDQYLRGLAEISRLFLLRADILKG